MATHSSILAREILLKLGIRVPGAKSNSYRIFLLNMCSKSDPLGAGQLQPSKDYWLYQYFSFLKITSYIS